MNAQHTHGRLTTDESEHTEPYQDIWLMLGNRKVAKLSIDDAPVHDFNAEQRSFARRLVACWNACEGISTEALGLDGNLANGWRLATYAMRDAIAQRDKLLAALETLVGTQDNPQNGWRGTQGTDALFACEYCSKTHLDCTQIVHLDDCPVPKARSAIAEVKGGAV